MRGLHKRRVSPHDVLGTQRRDRLRVMRVPRIEVAAGLDELPIELGAHILPT